MQSVADTEQRVISIVEKQIGAEPGSLSPQDDLRDLNIESLDVIEIIFALEDEFGIEVPYNVNTGNLLSMHSVDDIIRVVRALTDGE